MTQPANSAMKTKSETRAPYVPPQLETVGRFAFVTGCSVAGGCLPINSSLISKVIEGRS
jgi:hypothetical protein